MHDSSMIGLVCFVVKHLCERLMCTKSARFCMLKQAPALEQRLFVDRSAQSAETQVVLNLRRRLCQSRGKSSEHRERRCADERTTQLERVRVLENRRSRDLHQIGRRFTWKAHSIAGAHSGLVVSFLDLPRAAHIGRRRRLCARSTLPSTHTRTQLQRAHSTSNCAQAWASRSTPWTASFRHSRQTRLARKKPRRA